MLRRANELRRRTAGRVRSVDMLRWREVSYGTAPEERLSIWELDDLAPRDGWPAVLLLHGGGWTEGSRFDFEALAPVFARRGVLAASADYRLAPASPWPAALDDALGALDFLRHQQVDLRRIAVWGHSAGGQLALLVALSRPDHVRCAVALGAPSDLRSLGDPGLVGRVFAPDQVDGASPLRVPCERPPPILLVHGTADRVCPVAQARAHRDARPGVELLEVPDGDHGLRWPPLAAWRARRRAIDWMVERLDLPSRGSKWRRR